MANKIGVMIIGAQKAGTTSLNNYLAQHPEIYTHFTLEFSMFSNIENLRKGFEYNFKRSVSDKKRSDNSNIFLAKTVGLMYKPDLLKELKQHNPDSKVIMVLRNPIERAFSAFFYYRKNGIEPYTLFEDAIFINDLQRFKKKEFVYDCDYIGRSNYFKHILNVYDIFPKENVKILLFEEMITDLNKYLNEITEFINLNSFQYDTTIKYNEGKDSKSFFVSKILSPRNNYFIKNILPLKQRTIIKQFLKKSNSKKIAANKKMDQDTHNHLLNVFKDSVWQLSDHTNLPVKLFWKEFF